MSSYYVADFPFFLFKTLSNFCLEVWYIFSLPFLILDALYVDTSFTKDSAVQNLVQNPHNPSFLNISFLA